VKGFVKIIIQNTKQEELFKALGNGLKSIN